MWAATHLRIYGNLEKLQLFEVPLYKEKLIMKKLFMLITLVLSTSLVFAASLKDSLRNFISEGKYIQITLKGNLDSANTMDMTVIIPRETVASIGLTKATQGEKNINMVVLTTTSVIDPLLRWLLNRNREAVPLQQFPSQRTEQNFPPMHKGTSTSRRIWKKSEVS